MADYRRTVAQVSDPGDAQDTRYDGRVWERACCVAVTPRPVTVPSVMVEPCQPALFKFVELPLSFQPPLYFRCQRCWLARNMADTNPMHAALNHAACAYR